MVVALRSLRVTSDLDSAGYVRGARAQAQATDEMSRAARAAGVALAQADAALDAATGKIAHISRTWIDGYGSAAKFESAVRSVGRAMDVGMDPGRAAAALQGIYAKFNLVADSTALARQGYVQLAPVVDAVNAKLQVQTAVAERAAASIKQAAAAAASQSAINTNLGVRTDFGTAARAEDIAAYGVALDQLRAKFNPVFAVSKAYENELMEISRAHQLGAISAGEEAAAVTALNERYKASMILSNSLAGQFGRNTYLSKQLSFQLFDIAQGIPLAFQSPLYGLQNLAIQTGQVSQLYMGQGGLKQAFADTADMASAFGERVKALGPTLLTFFTSPLGIAALAATAVGVAAATTIGIIVSRMPSADRAIKTHKDSIEGIKKAWDDAANGSEEYRRRALSEIQFLANQNRNAQQELLNQQIGGAFGMGRFTGGGLAAQLSEELLRMKVSIAWTDEQRAMRGYAGAVEDFLKSVEEGNPDLEKLNATITDIANKHAGETAWLSAAAALRGYAAAATETAARLKDVEGLMPDLRIDTAFEVAREQTIRNQGISEQAARNLEMARRRHGGDLFAIGARSPGQLSEAARMREEATPISDEEGIAGRQFRIDAAAALAYEQALYAVTEAERQRGVARDNAIESAQMEVDLIGKGIGETTRLTQETQMLQQAKDAARQAGTIVSPEEVAQIKAAADELGRLAQEHARLSLRSNLNFERSQIGRSDTEQRVADRMRGLYGDDYLSHMQDFEAQQIRINERLQEFSDIGREAFTGMFSDLRDQLKDGVGFWDAFASAGEKAVDRLSDKLYDMATDKIWDLIFSSLTNAFGGGVGGGPSFPGFQAGVSPGLHHTGGMVGSATSFRYVHPAYFDDVPHMHGGGNINWAAGERPLVGLLGERVLNRQETADYNRGRGDAPTQVKVDNHVYNNTGAKVQTKVTSDGRGNIRLDTQIDEQVARAVSSPRTTRAMRQNYGSETRPERT